MLTFPYIGSVEDEMKRCSSRHILIGFDRALRLAMENVFRLPGQWSPAVGAVGRVAAEEVRACVDSPSIDASYKDGYAVVSADVSAAAPTRPVELTLTGTVGAGDAPDIVVAPGRAARILSGAAIPRGADAVLAEEFAEEGNGIVRAFADAHPGRNILPRGIDVRAGEVLVQAGEELTPSKIGLLVAGGVSDVEVVRRPRVGLLATGDEVLLPGRPLEEGKLYASNLALQEAWLRSRGIKCMTALCPDSFDDLAAAIGSMVESLDVLITSGGAWKGDRDLVVKVLDYLGWELIFHRVRMGPGKAVGMGLLGGKPVFCLPGGPPSNEMAFLMIVFPAVLRMAGHTSLPFAELYGRLSEEVTGQADWTQFVHCSLSRHDAQFLVTPLDMTRRLSALGRTQAIVKIPEGVERLAAEAEVTFIPMENSWR